MRLIDAWMILRGIRPKTLIIKKQLIAVYNVLDTF